MAGVSTEIRTELLPNMNLERYLSPLFTDHLEFDAVRSELLATSLNKHINPKPSSLVGLQFRIEIVLLRIFLRTKTQSDTC